MARGATISFDPATMEWSVQFHEVGSTGFKSHERDVKEKYGNQLFNGSMEVTDPTGAVTLYADGCHIVERPDAGGVIQSMSKAEYEEFTGRPGSANEA